MLWIYDDIPTSEIFPSLVALGFSFWFIHPNTSTQASLFRLVFIKGFICL